jgi:hypothetical protein
MKQQYEGQGLTWFWHTLSEAFAIIGGVSVLGWSLYVLWRALT